MFIHLNTHTHYSLLRGIASPEDLCAAAKAAGCEALALTDTDGLYGLVLFLQAAKDHGIRPLVGAEVTAPGMAGNCLCPPGNEGNALPTPPGNEFPGYSASVQKDVKKHPLSVDRNKLAREFIPGRGTDPVLSATLLAHSQAGYANLCRILTDRHLMIPPAPPLGRGGSAADSGGTPLLKGGRGGSFGGDNFDLASSLARFHDGLVVLTPDLGLLKALCGKVEHLYAELVPGVGVHDRLKAARALEIPPVATNRVHFLTNQEDDWQLHRLLRAIDRNTTLSRLPEGDVVPRDAWLKPAQAMEEYFFFCPEAIENTARLAELCAWQPDFGLVFPKFEGMDDEQVNARLRDEAYRGAAQRYGEITEAVRARLEHELAMIREKRFASIFLVMQDIVKQSPRTCGRGSAAASAVSYCLEITHVDPIRHNLFFERFLNPGRKDPPDIDVDFAWDERDAVLDYVFRTYGADHTAMICNHVTFQARAAIHEVAKVYGLPEAEITAVTKKLSHFWHTRPEEAPGTPALRYHDFSPPWPDILRLARKLDGIPRHLSVHCGGVIITPGPVWDRVPVQEGRKEINEGGGRVRIIHWEKDQAEDAGLVKIDLLGNRSLGVIRDALMMLEANTGERIEFSRWNPIDDPATQEMIARGDTMGVFYIESPATRLLQKRAGKGDFEHAVIHSSIIRPAANPFIHGYLERLKGQPYEPLHPLLGDLLAETYGIMVYQEDVSRTAMALAGFDAAEADELRKILSKKHKLKRLADLQRKFVQGALDRGVDRDSIRKIWEMILSFAGYSFCKPHSASFALVSFKSAYLRAHHPAEFMAAVISNQGGYYSTFAYVSEARRMGLAILPPDVNASPVRWWGKDQAVRVGLMQIKGLSQRAMERIVAERQAHGSYLGFDDFRARVGLDASDLRLLVKAGAFDALEGIDRRAELMWRVGMEEGRIQKTGDRRQKNRSQEPEVRSQENPGGVIPARALARVGNRFGLADSGRAALAGMTTLKTAVLFDDLPTAPPAVPPYDAATLLRQEMESFGFLISRHPLELYRERLQGVHRVRSVDLEKYAGQRVQIAGWLITGKVVPTKKKELMEFLTFEDEWGLVETVFFPQAYDRFCHMLSRTRPFLLKGKVEEDFGAVTLTVDEVGYL